MKKLSLYHYLFIYLCFFYGCQPTSEEMRQNKIKCYSNKLSILINDSLYKSVMSQFADTFQILKTNKQYFGIPEIVENRIDKAIFFNKNKTACLLVVLKRNNMNLVFGTARVIQGMKHNKKWLFEVSLEYTFDKDYFALYKENSFENISKLARYNVLTDGGYKLKGCEIDEYYWFEELNK